MQYTVEFYNQSANAWNCCLYQQDPGLPADVYTLAWFNKLVSLNDHVTFTWEIDYSFVCGTYEKMLVPGVKVEDMIIIPADLNTANEVNLTYDGTPPTGAFSFSDPTSVPQHEGTLRIIGDAKIPAGQGVAGIGMSGAGTFVLKAEQNVPLSFTPTPTYWCIFGDTVTEAGVVMESEQDGTVEIKFENGATTMYVIANANNTLTVQSTKPALSATSTQPY